MFEKFEDTKGGNRKPEIEEGEAIQWPPNKTMKTTRVKGTNNDLQN